MPKSSKQSRPDSSAVFARLGEITYKDPRTLRAYERNARKHSARQIAALAGSIQQFGFTVPVLIDGSGELIAGHGRVEAAIKVGLAEIPTISAAHLTPAQVKAYRLADNRLPELASWDMEALTLEIEEIINLDEIEIDALGWSTAELDVLLDDEVASDVADGVNAPPANTSVRAGDLWLLGKHRLLCGSGSDPQSWERLLAGEEARMIFTDPPANVPVSGRVSSLGKTQHADLAMAPGEMSEAEFETVLQSSLQAMLPHVADGAVVEVCIAWRHMRALLAALDASGLTLIDLCCWTKASGGIGSLYRSKHELVFIAKKGSAPHINNVEPGKKCRHRTNVWDYAGVNGVGAGQSKDLSDHPTVKPIALVADAIRDVTHGGDIVLDAFMGSGMTLLAAERSGRICYGTEIEPRYVQVAIERWQEMTRQEAILDGDGRTWREICAEREEMSDVAA